MIETAEGAAKEAAGEQYKAAEKQQQKDEKEEQKQQRKGGKKDEPTDELGMGAKDEKDAEAQKVSGDAHHKKDKDGDGAGEEGDDPKKPKRSITQKLIGALSTKDSEPAGGLDKTPIPPASSGYTVRFTFHKCTNLPAADLTTVSSDPYFVATLTSLGIQPRHKEDPDLRLRSRTIRRSTDPEWQQIWEVGGVPEEGFKLKIRIYDEDSTDKDDRLGNVTIIIPSLPKPEEGKHRCGWDGIQEQEFKVKKRMGSWRAYALKAATSMCGGSDLTAHMFLSIELLGVSPEKGRMYTLGPTTWTQHYSPMIGRITGVKAPGDSSTSAESKSKVEKYDFQANQLQLRGPPPAELYHRFVEFKPFVRGMFTASGLRGKILNKALHHQHTQIYSYSSTTKYGTIEPETEQVTRRFLDQCHAQEEGGRDSDGKKTGGRLFTYVITLDGLMRFTETGKEFGVDLLSKHTMHSDVNVYIACSGEFFLRRKRRNSRLPHPTSDGQGPAAPKHKLEKMESPDSAELNHDRYGNHNGQGQASSPRNGQSSSPSHDSGLGSSAESEDSNEHKKSESAAAQKRGKLSPSHSHAPTIAALITGEGPGTAGSNGPDPEDFELIIDNDSGTYRPNKEVMPSLVPWLEKNFPGLKITFKDCGDDKLQDEKKKQREIKKGGKNVQILQRSGSGSSGWSSDQERLNRMGGDDEGKAGDWKNKGKRERIVDAVEDPEKVVKSLLNKRREKKDRKEEGKEHK